MKKILIGIVCLAALTACKDDDENPKPEENLLLGVWKKERIITISGMDNTTVLDEETPDACDEKSTYEYTSDGKYIVEAYSTTNQGCVYEPSTQNYTYNKSENKLTVGNQTADVLELTSNKLVVFVPDHYDYNNDGVDDYLKYTFVK
ncbi:MAG: lipocalin family protein [Flavobacteriaceae bacterium]|nr:lipocalin family protein [Flavobacteriaceae bacterium]